tara:strand:+ start:59635 stop:60321 length:687 start_codon:yes stop_codon:yes gene_type:complete
MNKKGQIYIVAALILSVIIFDLSQVLNQLEQKKIEDNFEELSDNYALESSKLINSLINSEKEILDSFSSFTLLFTSYSKAINPSFGLIYSLEYDENIQIGNFLNEPITVDNGTTSFQDINILNGCFDKISASIKFEGLSFNPGIDLGDVEKCTLVVPFTNKIWIQIGEFWYPFEIIKGRAQIMVVSKEEAQEQRKVFIGGEGFVKEDVSRDLTEIKGKSKGKDKDDDN